MSKRFSIFLVILTIVSGLIGGLISGRMFAVKPAMAVETKQSKVLTAEELRIVDVNDKLIAKIGEFRNSSNDITKGLVIYNPSGSKCLELAWTTLTNSSYLSMNDPAKSSLYLCPVHMSITLANTPYSEIAFIGADKDLTTGVMRLRDRKNTVSAVIMTTNEGGCLGVFGKGSNDGRTKARLGVNEYGYGAIGLWDKDGYRLK